jgi:hypothetical protein
MKIIKFFSYTLLALIGAIALTIISYFIIWPNIPNTPTAKQGLEEMDTTEVSLSDKRQLVKAVNLKSSSVSNIFFDMSSTFSGGDYTKCSRFTYTDDKWLNSFIEQLNLPHKNNKAVLSIDSLYLFWWDSEYVSQLPERFSNYTGNNIERKRIDLAIDRVNHHIYFSTSVPTFSRQEMVS